MASHTTRSLDGRQWRRRHRSAMCFDAPAVTRSRPESRVDEHHDRTVATRGREAPCRARAQCVASLRLSAFGSACSTTSRHNLPAGKHSAELPSHGSRPQIRRAWRTLQNAANPHLASGRLRAVGSAAAMACRRCGFFQSGSTGMMTRRRAVASSDRLPVRVSRSMRHQHRHGHVL